MPPFSRAPVSIRAPATSANLGPGFDTFGLALAFHDQLTVRVADRGLDVRVDGEGATDVARDESHLVVRAMRAAFDRLGGQPPGLALHCTNRIPHGRGLGSSAAAIISGILAARELVEGGVELLHDDAVLAMAADIEGHPDNVAACLLGGFTISWRDEDRARAIRLDPVPAITTIAFVPSSPLATAHARSLLPELVPHCDAAHNAARAALLVAAMTAQPDLLLAATEDRLHQDYRAPAMPESIELVRQLRAEGTPAMISGAGPTVLAFQVSAPAPAKHVVTDGAWSVYEIGIDSEGACRVRLIVDTNP